MWYSANEHQESGTKQYMTENTSDYMAENEVVQSMNTCTYGRASLCHVFLDVSCRAIFLKVLAGWERGGDILLGFLCTGYSMHVVGFRIRHGVCTP